MSIEVKVPQLPESVADATLVSWHKKAGEAVRRDENLVDLETDKVVLEVPAPADGVLKQIVAADGAVVTSGQVLAILEIGQAGAAAQSTATAKPAAAQAPPAAAKPSSSPPPAKASSAAAPAKAPASAAPPEPAPAPRRRAAASQQRSNGPAAARDPDKNGPGRAQAGRGT